MVQFIRKRQETAKAQGKGSNGQANGKPAGKPKPLFSVPNGATKSAAAPQEGNGQNGKRLPLAQQGNGVKESPQAKKEQNLKSLSDEELIEVANGHHLQFVGCISKAVKAHARIAGKALLLLKSRRDHGDWETWLKKHFKGSPEMARLYMRMAKGWELVVELGLDREDITLTKLRWVLSNSEGPPPGSKKKAGNTKNSKEKSSKDEGANADTAAPKNYVVAVDADEVADFVSLANRVGKKLGTNKPGDGERESRPQRLGG
jgi:hypothetical protein